MYPKYSNTDKINVLYLSKKKLNICVEIRIQKCPLGNFAHNISFLLILQIYAYNIFSHNFYYPSVALSFFPCIFQITEGRISSICLILCTYQYSKALFYAIIVSQKNIAQIEIAQIEVSVTYCGVFLSTIALKEVSTI